MRIAAGTEVQAIIATLILGGERTEPSLGDVILHPHQREGADRAHHLLTAHGGALVADDVGLGKTYLALAVATAFARPLVVAPAALRASWTEAMRSARVSIPFASMESLGRGVVPADACDLLIVDEAQHFRNASTKRFAACRSLCMSSKVLLLTATPVHNRVADVRTVLSLFLGERAHALSDESLAAYVVRREAADVTPVVAIPESEAPRWLQPDGDADCLTRIVELPPPLAAADEGDGGALLTYTLVKQWASSRAALRSALSRRLARAHALEDALAAGRMPSRAELGAWTFAGGSQQLAFPLIAATAVTSSAELLLERVQRHRDAVRELASWMSGTPDPDESRALRLRELCAAHPDRRVIAFSEYTDTVAALFRLLAPHLRVALLTHAGGRVAGGRTTRRDLLESFTPGAGARLHERDRVDLLLATDVLSEGVGLHDASVVVHLDIPWNPARLAQRVGRVRRIGSKASAVLTFAMAPPAPAMRMLELESRLKRKVDDAARAIGVTSHVLPRITGEGQSETSVVERRATVLRRWRGNGTPAQHTVAQCGAVRATRHGAIACVRFGGAVKLVAIRDGVIQSASVVDEFLLDATTESVPVHPGRLDAAKRAIDELLEERRATDVVDLSTRRIAVSRRDLLHRAERIAHAAPRHARAALAPMLFAARSAAAAPLSAGAERVLYELSRAPLTDEAWLRAIGEFASLHSTPTEAPELLALLLLVPSRG